MARPTFIPRAPIPFGAGVFPDFGAVNGAADLTNVIGAVLMFVLITAVLMLIICGVTWATANAHGNHHAATKAKTGLWVAVGTAALGGAGVTWINFLINLGPSL